MQAVTKLKNIGIMAKHSTTSVKLRLKPLAHGRFRYYLDIYKNGQRSYEFLPLYKERATDEETRNLNANSKANAESLRYKRELDLIQNTGGIRITDKNLLLIDWLRQFRELKAATGQSNARALTVNKLINHIIIYKGDKTLLANVDLNYCRGFVKYLTTAKSGRDTVNEKTLSKSSAKLYFSLFTAAMKQAVREDKIAFNPMEKLDKNDRKPLNGESKLIEYLTIEELKLLMQEHCSNREVERAFLFSCFTGIRISDIKNLTWDNISKRGDNYILSFKMQKTTRNLVLKLNKQAIKYLPDRTDNYIFDLPSNTASINNSLKSWAKRAGVNKNIHFHTARHTFATMELTMKVDLYTISKLLGHKNLSSTQVYSDVIDKEREKAIDKLDKAF